MNSETLSKFGEKKLIKQLARILKRRHDVVVGCGDDCAVVSLGPTATDELLLTSDAVIENIHFDASVPLELAGRKIIGRVISDIAAMSGQPSWCLIDLVAPPERKVDEIMQIYSGMTKFAEEYNMAIVGGDTARGGVLELHAFCVGTIPRGRAVLRSGAGKGDALFVTGTIGGSRSGKHLNFLPRLREGIFLRDWASSMIDISDGLASDLRHLIEASAVGVEIFMDKIPVSDVLNNLLPSEKIKHAFTDGEDFELLFTVPEKKKNAFLNRWNRMFDLSLSEIGIITETPGKITTKDQNDLFCMPDEGFDHFLTT